MKGKKYLLTTSILIITGALAGLACNLFSTFFQNYWHIPVLAGTGICLLFLLTGILGLIYRRRYAFICIALGILSGLLSLTSVPLMFWIGDGSAPVGMLLAAAAYVVIFIMYMRGASLNRRAARTKEYLYAASFR